MSGEIRVGAKVDDGWHTMVAVGTSNSGYIFNPSKWQSEASNLGITAIDMNDYTGVYVRVKYSSGGALSTTPYVCVYGERGGEWALYKDENGNRMIPLASATTSDLVQSPWMYTDHSAKVDVLGSKAVLVQVVTAAVCNITSAVTIQLTRY